MRLSYSKFPITTSWIFLPYISLYFLWYLTNWPTSILLSIFASLHLVLLTLFTLMAVSKLKRKVIPSSDIIFWCLIFFSLLLPGVYLEYPSDQFEHFRRIASWQNSATVADNSLWTKSFYFWYWSFVQFVPIELRRHMLSFVSALTQLILATQVFSLSRALGFDKKISYIQVIAFFALFGTTIFGMRYYALATTIIAYAAYFRGLTLFLLPWKQISRQDILLRGLEILFLILFISFNHIQELLFLVISFSSILTLFFFQKSYRKFPKRTASLLLFTLCAGVISGLVVASNFPDLYGNFTKRYINIFGSYNIFAKQARVFNTLGIHGIWALAFSIILFKKKPILSVLTISPFFLLLFPPSFLAFVQTLDSHVVTYRLLFAFPTSFAFVYSLQFLVNKFSRKLPFKSSPFLPLLAVVIIIGSIPWEPWCGRLFFQFYQPSKSRELIETDQTAQWLTDNFSSINNCYFVTDGELASFTKWRTKQLGDSKVCVYLTDPVTAFGLSAHFGKHYWMERLKPRKFGVLSDRCQEIIDVFASAPYENSNVGVLIPIESEIPQLERSASADLSHHWLQMHSDITKNSINLGEIENCFLSHNWKSIEVPPYYKLLIPRE